MFLSDPLSGPARPRNLGNHDFPGSLKRRKAIDCRDVALLAVRVPHEGVCHHRLAHICAWRSLRRDCTVAGTIVAATILANIIRQRLSHPASTYQEQLALGGDDDAESQAPRRGGCGIEVAEYEVKR